MDSNENWGMEAETRNEVQDTPKAAHYTAVEMLMIAGVYGLVILLVMPIIVFGFSQGKDGGITVWNLFGLVIYPCMLYGLYRLVKWLVGRSKK